MIKKDFGSIVANKRKERRLSQPQLAALLCERGLDVKAHSISKMGEKCKPAKYFTDFLPSVRFLRFPI